MKKISDILNGHEVYALLEDSKSEDGDSTNLLFTSPQEYIVAWTEEELPAALTEIESLKATGLYLCGFLSYEAGYHFINTVTDKGIDRRLNNHTTQPLLYFIAFNQLQELSRKELDDSFAEINPDFELCPHGFNVSVSREKYLDAIESIGGYINAGKASQLNYSIKYRFDLQGNVITLYKALRKKQSAEQSDPVKYAAVLNFPNSKIVSLSNELLASKKDDVYTPDFLKNDKHESKSKPLSELMTDLFPSDSVTGEPKVRAMEIIDELEKEPRGIYAGSIGYLLPNDDFCFSVSVRTIEIGDDNSCEMGISSGLLNKSTTDKSNLDENQLQTKYEDCLSNASFLTGINDQFYLIETMKFDGEIQDYIDLNRHLERLSYSADYFGFILKQNSIEKKLENQKEQLTAGSYKVRLTAHHNGDIELTHELLPVDSDEKLITLGTQKIDSKSLFQSHKTSRRKVYNEEYEKAAKAGFYDAIIFNEHDEIAEACRHNIFVKRNGKWYTPPLSAGALDGIERQNFIQKTEAIEKFLTLDQIQYCEEIILTNSVRGEVSVKLDANCSIPDNLDIPDNSLNIEEYYVMKELAIKGQALILDVRLPRDYEESQFTLPNSEWKDPTLIDEWISDIPKDKKVALYCVHGRSISESVTERLLAEGIDASFIQTGIEGIREAGVEVVSGSFFRKDIL